MTHTFKIQDLHVKVKNNDEQRDILRGLSLQIKTGEVHCLMGPNGSGKSTLALSIMGHPKYEVEKGEILLNGQDILAIEPHERAKAGIFLSFQYPSALPGVTLESLIRAAYNAQTGENVNPLHFRNKIMKPAIKDLKIPVTFLDRYANDGFSGGEKKKAEILQMSVLKPKIVILDETDSGLDVDALKLVCEQINLQKDTAGILVITHYPRILEYLKPDFIHVMQEGRIALSAPGQELAHKIEQEGYENLIEARA